MYVDSWKTKSGISIGITYTDPKTGKRTRLPQSKHPKFKTKEEAKAWVSTQEAHQASLTARVQAKLEWRKKYYDFEELLTKFEAYYKLKATNSWEGVIGYLEQYVFHFFLDFKECNNLNQWCLYFPEFKQWLQSEDLNLRRRSGQGKLAFSTMNNIIIGLNAFITVNGRREAASAGSVVLT